MLFPSTRLFQAALISSLFGLGTNMLFGQNARAQILTANQVAAQPRIEAGLLRLRTVDPEIEIVRAVDRAVPKRLNGDLRPAEEGDPIVLARRFLSENADVFGIEGFDDELRLDSNRTTLRTDTARRSAVTFQQQFQGIDVKGCSLRVHLDRDGAVRVVHGRFEPGLARAFVDRGDSVGIDRLRSIVRDHAHLADLPILDDEARKIVIMIAGEPVIAWEAIVKTRRGLVRYQVAVSDGAVLGAVLAEAHEQAYTGYGYDPFGTKRTLHTSRETVFGAPTGDYKLWFDFHDTTVHGYDITGDTSIGLLEDHCKDSNNKWASSSQEAETAAWFNIHQVLEYFYSVHDGWDSFDGKGGKIKVGLHALFAGDDGSLGDDNASAEGYGSSSTILVGDGTDEDGLPFSPLDVLAHEFTHAILHSIGVEANTDESGALHEAVADVFGLFVEKRFGNAHGKSNFRIGEEVYVDWETDEIRNIAAPTRDHYFDFDASAGAHSNSTILSHAAYWMWKGGNHSTSGFYVNGIGHKYARKVWFNAIVDYLNETDPDFLDMRYALEDAAEEMGSGTQIAVERAFNAIGVTSSSCDLAAALKGFSGFTHDKGASEASVAFYTLGSIPAVGLLDAELEDGSKIDDVLVIIPPPTSSESVYAEMRVRLAGTLASFEPHVTAKVGFTQKAKSSAKANVEITVTPYVGGVAVVGDAITKTLTIENNGVLGEIDLDLRDIASSLAVIRLEITDLSGGCGAVALPELRLSWN